MSETMNEYVKTQRESETPLLELAEANLERAKANYTYAIKNMEECMAHMLEQEACVERLKEEAEGKVF